MKSIIPLLVIFLCSFSVLLAQDADSVAYSDTESGTVEYPQEEGSETDYDDDEQETIEHTLVEPDELAQTKSYSKEKLSVKKFDQKKWKEVVGSTDYNEKPKKKKKETEQEETKDEQPSEPPSITPWGGDILRVVAYAAIIALVIFIIYYVTKNSSLGKSNKKIIQEDDTATFVENIEDLDVHSLLRKTIADGNLRLAVRLYFLGLLKKLNEGGIILWKKDKTNREYLTELFIKKYYFEDVKRLTLAYEQVWYGEHTLSSEAYQKLFTEFEVLNQKLNTSKAS